MASASTCILLPTHFTISRTQLPSVSPSPKLLQWIPLSLRLKKVIRSQPRQKSLKTVLANPQGGDSIQETSDGTAERDEPQGPPFLTILAGFVVLLLLCWVFGSILLWIFDLIVKLRPSK